MSDDHIQEYIARDQYAMTDEQAVARALCNNDRRFACDGCPDGCEAPSEFLETEGYSEMAAAAGACIRARDRERAGEVANDLMGSKARVQAGWLRSIAAHMNRHTQENDIATLRLTAEVLEWDAERMQEAAATLASLQSALREKEAECERLKQPLPGETRYRFDSCACVVKDDAVVSSCKYHGSAEARLAQAREALRDLEKAAQAMLDCTDDSERGYLQSEAEKARALLETP